ncbi:MAG: hypothetical protein MUO40_13765 [Anaerolineaceae bacterium]|nr:hypothetical protein [Anaerolineaceae bacterium]
MKFLTLFTAPKPFTNPHIAKIQRNALLSWQALGELVEVVMIGDEAGMEAVAVELGIKHLPEVKTNALGTPLISSIFDLGRAQNDSPYLGYVNADILLMPDLISALKQVGAAWEKFLFIGQRWDLDVNQQMNFGPGWVEDLIEQVSTIGLLHPRTGSDYFIFPRKCFTKVPDFAVGRARWDNWMIYHGRESVIPVVDATNAVMIVHQNHDYSHLPGGQPHYKMPESDVNLKLAGGGRTVFQLDDCTHEFRNQHIRKMKNSWKRLMREIEIWPLIRLHSRKLGWLSFAMFHPKKALGEIRGWLKYKLRQRETKA